jgi:hypothetical protein
MFAGRGGHLDARDGGPFGAPVAKSPTKDPLATTPELGDIVRTVISMWADGQSSLGPTQLSAICYN